MSAALCVLLAATLLVAGVAKAHEPAPSRATLRMFVSPGAAKVLAIGLPAAEVLLAGLLVAGVAARLVAGTVVALMLAFTIALTRLERRSRSVPASCHCFGAASDGDPAAGRVRNMLLAAAAVAAAIRPSGALWDVAAPELAGAATVALGLACTWQMAVALVPDSAHDPEDLQRQRRTRP